MVIEFFGVPGSGKTTAARELIKDLAKNEIAVICFIGDISPIRKVLLILRMVLSFKLNLKFFLDISNLSFRDVANLLYVQSIYLASRNKIVLIDQGFVQALISAKIYNATVPIRNIQKHYQIFDRIVILCEEPIAIIEDRLKKRNGPSRLEKMGLEEQELLKWFEETDRISKELDTKNFFRLKELGGTYNRIVQVMRILEH